MKITTVYSNRSEKAGLLNVARELEELGHDVQMLDALEDDTPAEKFQAVTSRTQCALTSSDMLLVYSDRYEQLAATCVAHVCRVPIAHIHGGELSFGSFDNASRHAISMMADIHFPATMDAGQRLMRFGIDPNRIWVCGAPALDNMVVPTVKAFEEEYGFLPTGMALVAYHPDSLTGEEKPEPMFEALQSIGVPCIFTAPNGEPGSERIQSLIEEHLMENDSSKYIETMGPFFRTAMKHCLFMIGNSSAGIIEAASFGCPVVNVGRRQEGRQRGCNILDTPMDVSEISFRIGEAAASRGDYSNPYQKDNASKTIANYIDAIPNARELLRR